LEQIKRAADIMGDDAEGTYAGNVRIYAENVIRDYLLLPEQYHG
jgi:hypothetical protein